MRVAVADARRSTLHVASYELSSFRPRVVVIDPPAPLVRWCRDEAVRDAVVGGFFVRPQYAPLGELRIAGAPAALVDLGVTEALAV